MRYNEITPPTTHPYVVRIAVDPADFHRLENLIDDARELRMLGCDDSTPDIWIVQIGCASERVASHLQDAWG